MNKDITLHKKNSYYFIRPVYEFNLPAGHSCPFANQCKICVDRITGKFVNHSTEFRCYAASSERFPAVRSSRWKNFDAVKSGLMPSIPDNVKDVRIHGSGDFYSQEYFDRWLELIKQNSHIKFWAFTKSVSYWVNRIKDIPDNFELQASVGGLQDNLISEYNLKYAKVFPTYEDAVASGLPIDTDDYYAAFDKGSFALVDNNKRK